MSFCWCIAVYTNPKDLPDVPHLHSHRRDLAGQGPELRSFQPEAVVDLCAMTGDDAEGVLEAVGAEMRLLVASSIDVYRAYASVMSSVVTDTVPLDEQAPLRTGPPPDRDYAAPGFHYDPARYEKLDVEAAYLARAGTVCRLPMIYGEHDYKHREEFILRRLRAGRERIQSEGQRGFGHGARHRTSPLGCALAEQVPHARQLLDPSQFLDLAGIGGRFAHAWSTLPTYVRTGKPGYHELVGMPFWDDLAARANIAASFDALIGPAGHGAPDPQFEITGGWKSVRTVVDVGGGTGQAAERFARFFGHTTFTVIRSIIVGIWIGLNAVSVRTAQELGGRQQHHVWSRHGGRLTRARDGSVRWVDEGLPIAYQVLDEGVPVYASDGEQVGTVDHVVSAPSEHIFHGIVMSAGGGRRFVAADQVASLHEHGVDLRIDTAAAAALPEPHGGAAAWRDRDPGVKPSRWTHILDLMSGADPRWRDWTEED
jgi:hypothetical protein